jgi:hypothetical protein
VEHSFSEKSLIEDWMQNKGYLELEEEPFKSPFVLCAIANDTCSLRPLRSAPSDNAARTNKMAVFARRTQTPLEHVNILLDLAVASSARQLLVNVDGDNKIGPLIDCVPGVHVGKSELSHYLQHFGPMIKSSATINPRHHPLPSYISHIGPEAQKSPTTHPVRACDPKVKTKRKDMQQCPEACAWKPHSNQCILETRLGV